MVAAPDFDYAATYGHSSFAPQVNWVTETPYAKNKSNTPFLKRNVPPAGPTQFAAGNLTKVTVLESFKREFNQLLISFSKQWEEKGKLFAFQDINVIEGVLINSIVALQILNTDNLRCEVTSDETILLRGQIRDLSIHWAILFDADEPEQHEVILNVYRRKQHVIATGGQCVDVMKKLILKIYPDISIPA